MLIELIVKILFYLLTALVGIYSLLMIYVLLRYGKSRFLSFGVSALFAVAMVSLFGAAMKALGSIPFNAISI